MTKLHIDKKSIGSLFSELKGKKFIIPDYQRPYKWDKEKCETLWNDIEEFSRSTEAQNEESYFLGTVVSYNNEDGNPEIIDGQQRMTSFMLLLRAFYTKLETMDDNNQNVKGLRARLEPCIWEIHRISGLVEDKANTKIKSEVATEGEKNIFQNIIETGRIDSKNNDNYTNNYRYFLDICSEYAKNNPLAWENLCVTILEQCIILPINCDSQDTALTIFSTLNDRGLPLSDSDIFKAKIYKATSEEKRKEFVEKWKELSEICLESGFEIDDMFRYYSHIIRGKNSDTSKEIALRKFYLNNDYIKTEKDLINELIQLAKFWACVEYPKFSESYGLELGLENRKLIQCLWSYPNEYWRYVLSVFYFNNKDSSCFNDDLNKLLKKLVSYLFVKFIDNPTVNAIKTDVFKYCVYLSGKSEDNLFIKDVDSVKDKISTFGKSKLSRSLILLHSYLYADGEQKELFDNDIEIEHIFPKKWQDTNYNGWLYAEAESYLERLGNKIPFEKKLNIQAGNGYFGAKKVKYSDSSVYEVQRLGKYHKNDWIKDDIEEREKSMIDRLITFFKENL
ncbi:DUF262 domain-containing protein [Haemophilus parainfluenzae]|uniref:DUF262 domain-containing protein n=1 Tax=Haemophilus parainfluenzae TaxID=729 RepID=UPI0018A553DF|nr:DUF262 domain-containing protein [Haemophilus parainfluenzae]QOR07295.1 DUF262 domain-containing protein [Haemophilus parainfluenzae]